MELSAEEDELEQYECKSVMMGNSMCLSLINLYYGILRCNGL